MREYEFHTLDVFTDRIFGGNPLAVFPEADGLSRMQAVARELNLSETVFVLPPERGGDARVRIFTPGREVPFAGHPTVGTAVFLVDDGRAGALTDGVHRVVLEEEVGPVTVAVTVRDGRAVHGQLTAAVAPEELPFSGEPADCAAMVGLTPADLAATPAVGGWSALGDFTVDRFRPVWASAGLEFFLIPLASQAACARAALNSSVWSRMLPPGSPSTMVYLVAPGEGDTDLHVRMFAPDIGVPEDPATGSACAALGGWLGARLPVGTHRWSVAQGVEMGRPSRLDLEVQVGETGIGVAGVETIRVGGGAVRVTRGVMRVP